MAAPVIGLGEAFNPSRFSERPAWVLLAAVEVCERRIDFGPGYRVYFGRDGGKLVILLVGGTKKRQQSDIEKAKAYWSDYKRRKKEGR